MSTWNTFDTPIPETVKAIAVWWYGLPAVLYKRSNNKWCYAVLAKDYDLEEVARRWKFWHPLPEMNREQVEHI